MGFIIGLLTFMMVLDCVVLVLLVLIQLPKKDAGAGLAFGGGATDALFGAGSGTVLTRVTKYAATIFFILAVVLAILQSHTTHRTSDFEKKLGQPGGASATMPAPGPAATAPTAAAPAATNPLTAPAVEATNLPVAATNTPAAK